MRKFFAGVICSIGAISFALASIIDKHAAKEFLIIFCKEAELHKLPELATDEFDMRGWEYFTGMKWVPISPYTLTMRRRKNPYSA